MGELRKLPNIGPEVGRQLNEAGVHTLEQLKEKGAKQAWLDIKAIDESACINRLYGLEGAIRNMRWHNLPDDVKKGLKEFYTDLNKIR